MALSILLLLAAAAEAATKNSPTKVRKFFLNAVDRWCDPDGHERSCIMWNGTIPGPELHVERGDTVHLVVRNKLMDRTTSLHVHGLFYKNQPWQDGVAMVQKR